MQSNVLRDLKNQTEHSSEKPYQSRSLEGLGALDRLGLEGLFLFVYPNLLSSGSIYSLEGDGEVFRCVLRYFAVFFGFLFDNTSPCYLVFASLFSYFYALLLLFVVHVYTVEWLYRIITLHLLLFCAQISQSKSN